MFGKKHQNVWENIKCLVKQKQCLEKQKYENVLENKNLKCLEKENLKCMENENLKCSGKQKHKMFEKTKT